MQLRSKLPLFLGLLLAVAGILILLIHINYLVVHQNTDYMHLFFVGIGVNIIGIFLWLFFRKRGNVMNP